MKVNDILTLPDCTVLVNGETDREISKIFCCDMLSVAMGKAPCDSVWVTVMGNKNTLAVATLTDVACIVFAEGVTPDKDTVSQAEKEGITLLASELPVFDIALRIHQAGL
ncbi:MAG: DRTGG domain-containing protein [Schaedlerella sp.]|nr:DRTGG domain-containing protein [Schaedlerella sp.]